MKPFVDPPRRLSTHINSVAADATTSRSVTTSRSIGSIRPATTSRSVTTGQSVTTSASSTPFWWRPHYTKLPSVKHGREDAISGASEPGSERSGRKGRAWLLVVAAGIAVGVACLIVCGLGVGRRLFIREKHKETVIHNYPIRV
jgi:hypothetical protein